MNNLSVDTSYTYYLVAENDNNDVSEMQTVKFMTLKRTLTKDDFKIVGDTEFTYTNNGDVHNVKVQPVEEKAERLALTQFDIKKKLVQRMRIISSVPQRQQEPMESM